MSKNEGSHGPQGPWAQNHKIIKIIKIRKITYFCQHGKDAHRTSAKGTLNDSSRSLIWSFLEQIVFLQIDEKVSKVLKIVHLRKYVKIIDELCIIKPLC